VSRQPASKINAPKPKVTVTVTTATEEAPAIDTPAGPDESSPPERTPTGGCSTTNSSESAVLLVVMALWLALRRRRAAYLIINYDLISSSRHGIAPWREVLEFHVKFGKKGQATIFN
jgi:uncharacterized protein (TIGR03382 family)